MARTHMANAFHSIDIAKQWRRSLLAVQINLSTVATDPFFQLLSEYSEPVSKRAGRMKLGQKESEFRVICMKTAFASGLNLQLLLVNLIKCVTSMGTQAGEGGVTKVTAPDKHNSGAAT